MKRLALALPLVAAGVAAVFVLRPAEPSRPPGGLPSASGVLPAGRSPDARAPLLPHGTPLAGRILDAAGAPLPGAQVLIARASLESMAAESCESPLCQEPLLSCGCGAASARVAFLVSRREGEWLPEVSLEADASGAFSWTGGVPGEKYTILALFPGLAPGVRHGALAGQEIVITLWPARAVHGRVVDERNAPVPGALVTAVPTLLPRFQEVTSAADGSFRIAGLGDGPLYLTASAPGFVPAALPLAAPAERSLTLVLHAPRTLVGRVRDGAAPARGATVRLYQDRLSRTLVASDGSFRAEGLPPGTWTVSASLGRAQASVEVKLTEALTEVELSLSDGIIARGRVSDEAGNPLAAAVSASSGGRRLADARCDENGQFRIEGLPAGAVLTATLQGYEPASARLDSQGSEIALVLKAQTLVRGVVVTSERVPVPGVQVLARGLRRAVATSDAQGAFTLALPGPGPTTLMAHHSSHGAGEVSVDAPADDVTLVLELGGGFRTRVVAPGGRPVAGARVMAWRDDDAARGETFSSDVASDEEGQLVLAGLPQGVYRARFSAHGFQPALRGDIAVPAAGLVDIGETLLESGEEIAGVVLKPDGSPAAGAFVHARTQGMRGGEGVATEPDGSFTLVGLKPGRYQVSAFFEKSVGEVAAQTGQRDVVVRLPPAARLKGRVVDERRQPIERFFVDGEPREDPDGRFEVPARAFRGTVFFRVSADGRITAFRQAEIQDGVADAGEIVLERSRVVEGQVLDGRGQPVAGAVVALAERDEVHPRDGIPPRATTGAEGRFRLEGLMPGPATLTARKGGLVADKAVLVPSEGDLRGVLITLQAKGAIEGTVRGPDGRPVPAQIHTRTLQTATDAAGRFRLEGLVPGPHLVAVVIESDSFRSLTRQVDVPEGETVRLDIDLAGGASLRIRIAGAQTGQVHLYRRDPSDAQASLASGLQIGQVLNGEAVFGGLSGGRYAFAFFGDELIAEGEADVPAGGTVEVSVVAHRQGEQGDDALVTIKP